MSERHLIVYGVAFFSLYFHCHDGTNFVCSYYIHFFSLIVILYTVRASNKQTHFPYLSFYTHKHTPRHTHPHTHTISYIYSLSFSLSLSHTHTLTHSLTLSHNNYCQSHDGTELSGVFICDDIAEPIEQLNVSLFTLMPNSFTHCFLVQIVFFLEIISFCSSSNFYFLYLINQVILCYKRHQLTTSEPFRR
jgi:hypothetical protein